MATINTPGGEVAGQSENITATSLDPTATTCTWNTSLGSTSAQPEQRFGRVHLDQLHAGRRGYRHDLAQHGRGRRGDDGRGRVGRDAAASPQRIMDDRRHRHRDARRAQSGRGPELDRRVRSGQGLPVRRQGRGRPRAHGRRRLRRADGSGGGAGRCGQRRSGAGSRLDVSQLRRQWSARRHDVPRGPGAGQRRLPAGDPVVPAKSSKLWWWIAGIIVAGGVTALLWWAFGTDSGKQTLGMAGEKKKRKKKRSKKK